MCFAGAFVMDIVEQIAELIKHHIYVTKVWIYGGTNDIQKQQSELQSKISSTCF